MLFIPFILVHQFSSCPPLLFNFSLCFCVDLFLVFRLVLVHNICITCYFYFLTLESLFILIYFLLLCRRFTLLFSLFFLSSLFDTISPHCHSFLIPFLSCSLNRCLSLLLATPLVFSSALLAPLSTPCL